METGGIIIVDGLGYSEGTGPGAGIPYASYYGSGGGHGGFGGDSTAGAVGGRRYDSITAPTDFGSGGGGNRGGAAVVRWR